MVSHLEPPDGASTRANDDATWWRTGGGAAIGFVIVFIAGVALQTAPPLMDDPVDEMRADWAADGQRYLVASYLLGLAFVVFFIPFVVALRGLLGRVEGGIEFWSRTMLFGAIATVLWSAWSSIFWGALAFGDFASEASDETLRTLSVLDYSAVSGAPFAFAVFVGAASVVIAATAIVPRWIAGLGAVEFVVSVVAPLSILTESSESFLDVVYLVSFLLLPLWILVMGVAMLHRASKLRRVP